MLHTHPSSFPRFTGDEKPVAELVSADSGESAGLAGDTDTPKNSGALRITLPVLYCPFPSAVHADALSIEEGTLAWMWRYSFIKTTRDEEVARRAQFGIRAARVHPTGSTAAIRLVSDLTVWLFFTDDVYVEKAGLSGKLGVTSDHIIHCVRVLRNPEDLSSNPNPSLLALQDISRRLRRLATNEQLDRIINGMVEFFLAGYCEAVHFSRRTLPTEADYIPVRDTINCLRAVCFVFIEIAGGFELSAPVWCRTSLQAVVNKAVRIVSNHHDILSGLRELANDVPMNLPAVIAREQGLPVAEAFARVGDIVNADVRSFIEMTNRLLADDPDPAVAAYVDGLKVWIRGNLDWSLITGRYRVDDHVYAVDAGQNPRESARELV